MKPVRFKVNNKTDSAELFIYDVVGGDLFGDGVTPEGVANALKEMKSVKNLTVRINSPGGDVFDGVAIRNLLLQSGKRLAVEIDGLAASIASVIAMAGDEVRMAEGGRIMIHDAWTVAIGDAEEMRRQAEILDGVSEDIAGIYAEKTKSESSEMRELMRAETWMGADEALERGFITAVSEPMRVAACIDPKRFRYKNIPEKFLPAGVTGDGEDAKRDALEPWRRRIAELRAEG